MKAQKVKFLLLFYALLIIGCGEKEEKVVYLPASSFSPSSVSPRELPKGIEKLDEYHKHLLFAGRYLEEGDYEEALAELEKAEKFKKGEDPVFYELKGKIYDALGDSDRAFESLRKAAWLYYKREELN